MSASAPRSLTHLMLSVESRLPAFRLTNGCPFHAQSIAQPGNTLPGELPLGLSDQEAVWFTAL